MVIANEAEAAQWPWRPTHLVTTLGARGARCVSADDEFWVLAPAVNAVDTTGAGDVFAGVLAANWPPHPGSRAERLVALQRACAAGALATLVPGAGDCAPDADAIDAALRTLMNATIAADIALVLFAVFGVLGFGWRSWLQHRRTGSTGFRAPVAGSAHSNGSPGWFGIALVVAVGAPILQRANVIRPDSALSEAWIRWPGSAIAAAGIAATVYAQLEMGDSWRIGVDEQETTALVHSRRVRPGTQPIYTAMFIFGLGIALLTPNLVASRGFHPARGNDRASGPPRRRAVSVADARRGVSRLHR